MHNEHAQSAFPEVLTVSSVFLICILVKIDFLVKNSLCLRS